MVLKKIKRTTTNVEMTEAPKQEVKAPEEKKTSKNGKSKLPPDTYKDEITPVEFEIDEHCKLIFSVKRAGEMGLPHIDIRQYITTEKYTGFTKKGINFPLEFFFDFMDKCQEVNEACDRKGLD